MSRRHYNFFNRFTQWIAKKPLGVAVFSPILPYVDRFILRLTEHRTTASAWLSGLPVVMLTTTGAKTGLPRCVPLVYIQDTHTPDTFAIVASNWGRRKYPAWYYNLKAHPLAQCEIDGQSANYQAYEAQGDNYDHYMALAKELYAGFGLYKKWASHRHIPIMVLTRV